MTAARAGARRRAAALVVALALVACKRAPPAPAAQSAAQSLAAIVASCAVVVGDVEVRRAGRGEWTRVTTGAVLRDGDAVRTGAGGFARVEFTSGNGIELEEGSLATVDAARPAEGGPAEEGERVALVSGVARGFFAEGTAAPARPLTVLAAGGAQARLAPAAGAGGVRFRLTASGTGTEIAITAGAASLATAGGEVALAAGRAVDLGAGGAGAPAELPEFPASVHPGVDARFPLGGGEISLAWTPAPRARAYRVQVARDLSFREVVLARDVPATSLGFAPAEAGMYAWRVASRDEAGRCGEYGFARRVYLDAQPPRDLLVAPAAGATVRLAGASGRVRFAWDREQGAPAYRLVIASGPDLTERPIRSAVTAADRLDVRGLAPGVYYWGVYVDDARREPLFARPRRLVVQRPLEVKVPRAVDRWGR